MVFEFMEWGDLTEVLRTRSPRKLMSSCDKMASKSDGRQKAESDEPVKDIVDGGNESGSNESSVSRQQTLSRVRYTFPPFTDEIVCQDMSTSFP